MMGNDLMLVSTEPLLEGTDTGAKTVFSLVDSNL